MKQYRHAAGALALMLLGGGSFEKPGDYAAPEQRPHERPISIYDRMDEMSDRYLEMIRQSYACPENDADIRQRIGRLSREMGVDPYLAMAVALKESHARHYDEDCRVKRSPTNAAGRFQITKEGYRDIDAMVNRTDRFA